MTGTHGPGTDESGTDGPGTQQTPSEGERRRRWRMLLGEPGERSLGGLGTGDSAVDRAMAALYDRPDPEGAGPAGASDRRGGLGGSAPQVARWLGDIRGYFPNRVVQVMQRDAVTRLGITRLLLEPELLQSVQPDVHLVGTLLTLKGAIPERTRSTARAVVRAVVEEVEKRVAMKTRSAVTGALNRAARSHRPKPRDIDWNATIRANLAHYLPEHRTVVPQHLIGYGRRQQSVHKEIVIAIDQSGSMAASVVYASVFAAVLAGIRTLKTSVVAFDTAVVDLTDQLNDPVDLLFGIQLGGGTDINRAIAYSQTLITRPRDAIFVLISDLFEGGVAEQMLRRLRSMRDDGVQVVVLLALSDDGAPSYDHTHAAAIADLGLPAFACTPDVFPDLLAAAISGGDIARFATS